MDIRDGKRNGETIANPRTGRLVTERRIFGLAGDLGENARNIRKRRNGKR